jgi:hypothetical protein
MQRDDIYNLMHAYANVHCKKSLAVFSPGPGCHPAGAEKSLAFFTLGRHSTDSTVTEKRCAAEQILGGSNAKIALFLLHCLI